MKERKKGRLVVLGSGRADTSIKSRCGPSYLAISN
jgi:hypothetical protein